MANLRQTIATGSTGSELVSAFNTNATNTNVRIFNVEDYGAVHDDSTDDTVAIQTAINTAFTAGGGTVYFPAGIYKIAGALQRNIGGIDYCSQLYIPDSDCYGTNAYLRSCVTLKGEFAPNMINYAGAWDSRGLVQMKTGAILKSTLISDVAYSYVIGSKGAGTNAVPNKNYNQCNIEDLSIQVTANGDGATTLGGIGFLYGANTYIHNVCVGVANKNSFDLVTPINNCVGIAVSGTLGETQNIIFNSVVTGMESGVLIGEHTVIKDVDVLCCKYAYNFGTSIHLNILNHAMAHWCTNGLYFSGVSHVKGDLNMEWYHYDPSRWNDTAYTVLDPNNYGYGKIDYHIIEAMVGWNNARFSKSGGSHLTCTPISVA